MSRRRAARRVRNIGASAGLLGLVAVLCAPGELDRPAKIAVEPTKPSSLQLQPFFRPAGEVLTRSKVAQAPALPFTTDAREQERRESLTRWHRVYAFSTRYRIKPELAGKIYDAAIKAGVEPELGFRIIRVESEFKTRATSRVGAVGLMQLMPATARGFEPNATIEDLYDPDVNLRIGFKYLRMLLREYKGDVKLALLVYNRGPVAVRNAISMGIDPANGYERVVMRGYKGRGVLD
jgi:soluble lytic murein transglycosylase-like protein